MKTLFEPHMEVCSKVMDLRLQRQNLVIGNISNINTPGYRPVTMDFEAHLQRATAQDNGRTVMSRTDTQHMPTPVNAKGVQGDLRKEARAHTEPGQDSVDLDKEMATLNKNSMAYDALTSIVREGFKGVNKVINESKG